MADIEFLYLNRKERQDPKRRKDRNGFLKVTSIDTRIARIASRNFQRSLRYLQSLRSYDHMETKIQISYSHCIPISWSI